MNALELLTTRRSTKKLGLPAPNEAQLHQILQAASQVPDHGRLTPWRFVAIQSEAGMAKFRQILLDTVSELNMGDEARQKAEKVGNIAPMVLAVIASPKAGKKPEWEQHLSAGCAAYAAQLAAAAQGFDNVWLSGLWVNSPVLRRELACTDSEKIIALIMLGTAPNSVAEAKNTDVQQFTQFW